MVWSASSNQINSLSNSISGWKSVVRGYEPGNKAYSNHNSNTDHNKVPKILYYQDKMSTQIPSKHYLSRQSNGDVHFHSRFRAFWSRSFLGYTFVSEHNPVYVNHIVFTPFSTIWMNNRLTNGSTQRIQRRVKNSLKKLIYLQFWRIILVNWFLFSISM